jgi:hypothetical protein
MERQQELEEAKREEERARILALRRLDHAKMKAKDELAELRRIIEQNPQIDVTELAEEFHVSMAEVLAIQKSMSKKKK